MAQAARLVFLLAGVSYYKTAAPPVIDLGDTPVTDAERASCARFYLDGLGEFAYRNGLDLSAPADRRPRADRRPAPAAGPTGEPAAPVRPLVPFGGGIDSIVTVEQRPPARRRRAVHHEPARRPFRRHRGTRPPSPACPSSGPAARSTRSCSASRELGFLNGHVPVTGILSAIAVMAAVLDGRDAVIMSNEWSASIPTLEVDGRPINHQYSKSAAFEAAFRAVLADALGPPLSYFSALRPFTELWVARAVRRARPSTTARSAAATAPSTSTRRAASTTGAAGATSAASST